MPMTKATLSSRERVNRAMTHQEQDRIPRHDTCWGETLDRWMGEGLPGTNQEDAMQQVLHALDADLHALCWYWPHPFPGRDIVLEEDNETRVTMGPSGTIERQWKQKSGTPEHLGWDCDTREKWDREYKPALLNEQLQLEVEERRRAERLKDEFVSTVSHELRTPLAITREGVSLLIDGIPGPINEKQAKVLTTAKGNVDRLTRIINDLLDISKIEAGRMEIKREKINVGELVAHAAAALTPLAIQKGLRLDIRVPDKSLEVFADEDRLVQVLNNLLSNAIKFTREGGVTVSVAAKEEGIECVVEDTGAGVSEEDMPRLFHKFVQIGRTNGAGRKGTGLGLVIARNIVELHGGRIWAESELHKGTRFTFVLPMYSAEQLLIGEIDDKIVNARQMDKEFSLFLWELQYDVDPALGEAKKEALGRAIQHLLQTRTYLRHTDSLELRGDQQVVLLAEVGRDYAATVSKRWRQIIEESLRDVTAAIPIRLVCGEATYPHDGADARELLQTAENSLG